MSNYDINASAFWGATLLQFLFIWSGVWPTLLAILLQVLKVEAFHYNTTNQCNHYVTELFEIKIDYTTQKLKSIKKETKLFERFAR